MREHRQCPRCGRVGVPAPAEVAGDLERLARVLPTIAPAFGSAHVQGELRTAAAHLLGFCTAECQRRHELEAARRG